jgi:ABC-type bacteriocin/lantibiotic exporter with double-glycine peptidase domain
MSKAAASRARRDALSALAATPVLEAHAHLRQIGRDAAKFFQLLVRTLSTLPGDVVAASIVINLLGLALPLGILQIYDRVVPNAATATLSMLSIGIGIALLMEIILRIVRSRVLAWSAMKLAWQANVDAVCRVATAPAQLVDSQPAARWLQRLQAVATLSDFGMSRAPLLLIDMVFAVIFIPLLLASSGWLAAVPLVVFVFFGAAAIERGREMRDITAERLVAETSVRDFLVETLNDIVTVKALGAEQQFQRRFERLSEQAAGHTYRIVRLVDDSQSFAALVSTLTQIATATIGAILAINGQISIGVVACSTILAGRIIQPLLRVVSAWNEIQAAMVAEEVARPIHDLPQGDDLGAPSRDPEHQPAMVVFDEVSFAYTPEGQPILVEANLAVAPGEIIAITGADNSGKSTIRRLLAGQLSPTSGRVLIDGHAATEEARKNDWVAVVDHRNAVVRGSVLNNLTLFGNADQLEAARAAARAIGLEADIDLLTRGYDTRLGEAASEAVPTGLLQRIAIARAIANRPRLLILDEANNTLDRASELALGAGLGTLRDQMTIVLITNRPSFAALADHVFTLLDGKFCELDKSTLQIKSAAGRHHEPA